MAQLANGMDMAELYQASFILVKPRLWGQKKCYSPGTGLATKN